MPSEPEKLQRTRRGRGGSDSPRDLPPTTQPFTNASSTGAGGANGVSDPTSVSQQVTGLMSKQNPLMRQARARGAQAANRRGLMNTSMGVRAGESAAFDQAVPIASQEAQQAQQSKIAKMNVAADDRKQAANLAASFENSYANTISNIMSNTDLPASAREKYTRHAAQVRDSNLAMVEQMYGIELDWATPQGAGSGGGSQGTVDSVNQQAEQISSLEKQIKDLEKQQKLNQGTWKKIRGEGGGGLKWVPQDRGDGR